jgi:hypothetical protein
MGDREKKYVHMLNATLCATGRAICCLLENYQDEGGVKIPEVLVPFMGGITYLPFVRDSKLAPTTTSTVEKPLTTKGENKAPQPPKEEKKKEEKPKEATVKPAAAPKEEKKKEKTSGGTEGGENNKKEGGGGKKEEKKEKKEKKEGGAAAHPAPAKAAEPVFAKHPGAAGITAPPKYVSPAAVLSSQARTSHVPIDSHHHQETAAVHHKESTTHNNNNNNYDGITFDSQEHPTKVTSVDLPQVEQRLMDYNYIFGDRAGAVDCLVFNHLFPTSSTTTTNNNTNMPEFPNMQRWKRHVGSFTQEQRQQWK